MKTEKFEVLARVLLDDLGYVLYDLIEVKLEGGTIVFTIKKEHD